MAVSCRSASLAIRNFAEVHDSTSEEQSSSFNKKVEGDGGETSQAKGEPLRGHCRAHPLLKPPRERDHGLQPAKGKLREGARGSKEAHQRSNLGSSCQDQFSQGGTVSCAGEDWPAGGKFIPALGSDRRRSGVVEGLRPSAAASGRRGELRRASGQLA